MSVTDFADPRPAPTRMRWLRAELVDAWLETRTARTLVLDVPGWPDHLAGQHVDVRLTAEDGYSAQRSYSIASEPSATRLQLTVERVTGGEVSGYLVEVMRPGDQLELRGPIGGWFAWHPVSQRPALLVGGGSGIVPLMSMIRHRARTDSAAPFRLVYSVRTPDHVYFAGELAGLADTHEWLEMDILHTRSAPSTDPRGAARVNERDLAGAVSGSDHEPPVSFVCGPTGFVENAAGLLVRLGHDPSTIRTERFGPTGA